MIQIKNLKKSYGTRRVLNGITAEIHKGETVAILGSSGGGKSTLLRCINRLEEPTEGRVFLSGVEISAENIFEIRKKVGMVFQNFYLFSHMSVMENLTYAPVRIKGMSIEAALEKAKSLLIQVGLENRAHSYPHTLSGGEKQRIAIARTLMMDPQVILFDEPTSALDPEMVQEVLKVIKSLASTGITILIVTHEMGFVKEVATRVLFLDRGVVLEDRKTQEFFEGKGHERVASFLSHSSSQ